MIFRTLLFSSSSSPKLILTGVRQVGESPSAQLVHVPEVALYARKEHVKH